MADYFTDKFIELMGENAKPEEKVDADNQIFCDFSSFQDDDDEKKNENDKMQVEENDLDDDNEDECDMPSDVGFIVDSNMECAEENPVFHFQDNSTTKNLDSILRDSFTSSGPKNIPNYTIFSETGLESTKKFDFFENFKEKIGGTDFVLSDLLLSLLKCNNTI